MVINYDWYSVVEGSDFQQGDFFFDLDVPIVDETKGKKTNVNIEIYDTVVMTQSCDIPKKAVEHIMLCPVWSIDDAVKRDRQFSDKQYLERVRKGQVYKFHMLNECNIDAYKRKIMIVQFEKVIVRPKKTMIELFSSQKRHLRLLPPYREEMAQRFGIFFSRVAKPADIPCFD